MCRIIRQKGWRNYGRRRDLRVFGDRTLNCALTVSGPEKLFTSMFVVRLVQNYECPIYPRVSYGVSQRKIHIPMDCRPLHAGFLDNSMPAESIKVEQPGEGNGLLATAMADSVRSIHIIKCQEFKG